MHHPALLLPALLTVSAFGQIKVPGVAADPRPPSKASDVVSVQVVADTDQLRPGTTMHLAVVIDIAHHWHIYWVNPGDSGAPTELEVSAPEGFVVGPTQYPRPRVFREPDGITYGYEKQTVLFVPVRTPDRLPEGEVVFSVSTHYFVCKEICMMGSAQGTVTLSTQPTATTADGKLLQQYRRRVPRPLKDSPGATARIVGNTLVIEGPMTNGNDVQLLPIETPGVSIGRSRVVVDAGRFRLQAPLVIKPQNAEGRPLVVRGIIGLGGRTVDPSFSFDVPVTGTTLGKGS